LTPLLLPLPTAGSGATAVRPASALLAISSHTVVTDSVAATKKNWVLTMRGTRRL
jgi:hypothetical protein